MNLQELKDKSPADLILEAEKLGIENPSTMRKQEILFAILKKFAEKNEQITASGVLETLQDGFGFLRAMESNYLPGPDDIYVRILDFEYCTCRGINNLISSIERNIESNW